MIRPRQAFHHAVVAVAAGVACASCQRQANLARQTWPAMGTFASVTVPENDSAALPILAAEVKAVLEGLETKLSVFRPESDVSRMNAAAGSQAVPIAAETAQLLEMCAFYSRVSDGAFDVTIGPAVALWRLASRNQTMPSDDEIRAAAALVNYRYLAVENGTAFLAKKGMSADLGGIAKGFAVDMCLSRLSEIGAGNAMVDLGGNIRCIGTPVACRPWHIGVRDPFDPNRIVGRICLTSGVAVATSANYERFVEIGGRKFGHILDPRTAMPASEMASVTIIAPTACEADALSTAIFVLGMKRGRILLKRIGHCEAILVPNRQPLELWITTGIRNTFTPQKEHARQVRILDTE